MFSSKTIYLRDRYTITLRQMLKLFKNLTTGKNHLIIKIGLLDLSFERKGGGEGSNKAIICNYS